MNSDLCKRMVTPQKPKKRRSSVLPYELRKKKKVKIVTPEKSPLKRSRPSKQERVPNNYEEWSIEELEGTSTSIEDSMTWSHQNIKNLERVVRRVPALSKNFWEEVARKMGPKYSSVGCQRKYTEAIQRPKTRQKCPKVVVPKLITGKAGTVKRKREFRGAMEFMDKEYSDDIFDSTPLKKRKKTVKIADDTSDDDDVITPKKKKRNISTDQSDEEGDGDECDEAHDGTITSSGNNWRVKLGAPISRTPTLSSHLLSPKPVLGGGGSSSNHHGYRDREIADKVMYQLSNSRKSPVKKKVSSGTNKINAKKPKDSSLDTKLYSIRTGELMTWHVIEDSDSGSDSDPFSDKDLYSKLKSYYS